MLSANRILQGVRILTFTTGYAGPYAGRLLASYGAEVIKIERPPHGDRARPIFERGRRIARVVLHEEVGQAQRRAQPRHRRQRCPADL